MKKRYVIGLLTIAFGFGVALNGFAQSKVEKTLDKTGKSIEKGAKTVGNKTAEVAVKGTSKVADKVWEGKVAPDGSDVYINGKNRKYYVNKKGAKVYLKDSQIKNKPAEKK